MAVAWAVDNTRVNVYWIDPRVRVYNDWGDGRSSYYKYSELGRTYDCVGHTPVYLSFQVALAAPITVAPEPPWPPPDDSYDPAEFVSWRGRIGAYSDTVISVIQHRLNCRCPDCDPDAYHPAVVEHDERMEGAAVAGGDDPYNYGG